MLIHTDQKPFCCDFLDCDKRFRSASNLKVCPVIGSSVTIIDLGWITFRAWSWWRMEFSSQPYPISIDFWTYLNIILSATLWDPHEGFSLRNGYFIYSTEGSESPSSFKFIHPGRKKEKGPEGDIAIIRRFSFDRNILRKFLEADHRLQYELFLFS